ncbi:hypothetical protein [Bailinhaonella thermotolerans]|nr:hypothetical protein [Bailinhaonella thermotolerans]
MALPAITDYPITTWDLTTVRENVTGGAGLTHLLADARRVRATTSAV